MFLKRYLPILQWLPAYRGATLREDLLAAFVVTVMLVPQSLAYALLAGVPPQVGLYASIAPLVCYALFGSSRALAVGPVAVIALMTAATASALAPPDSPEYLQIVLVLALLSGLIQFAMGLLRLGFLANFLSHPVIAGFISASAVLIALSQIRHLLGIPAQGSTLWPLLRDLATNLPQSHGLTLFIGLLSIALLYLARSVLPPWLRRRNAPDILIQFCRRFAPIIVVILTTLLVWRFDWQQAGVAVVGNIPASLPPFTLPEIPWSLARELVIGALLISLVGFVESVSVGQTLAAKRREHIVPDQELLGLGAANLGAAFSGGMPVTGGFSRSVVNEDAGAQTPLAGVFTAIGILAVILWFTPWLAHLPRATLAATIIVAIVPLIDRHVFAHSWRYNRADFSALVLTVLLTLGHSVESGLIAGVALSVALHLYRTGKPHIAILGCMPNSEHFRNIRRHRVLTRPDIIFMRVDESLYFPNVRHVENRISEALADYPEARHLVLVCSAINHIDTSGLDSLYTINQRLHDAGVALHLAEVKGPVHDRLQRIGFTRAIHGHIFLSAHAAWQAIPHPTGHSWRKSNSKPNRQAIPHPTGH